MRTNVIVYPSPLFIIPEDNLPPQTELYVLEEITSEEAVKGPELEPPVLAAYTEDEAIIGTLNDEGKKLYEKAVNGELDNPVFTPEHLEEEHKGIGVMAVSKGENVNGPSNVYTQGIKCDIQYLFLHDKMYKKYEKEIKLIADYIERES